MISENHPWIEEQRKQRHSSMALVLSMTFLFLMKAIRSFTSDVFAVSSIPVPKNVSTVLRAVVLVFILSAEGWMSLLYLFLKLKQVPQI